MNEQNTPAIRCFLFVIVFRGMFSFIKEFIDIFDHPVFLLNYQNHNKIDIYMCLTINIIY